MFTSIIGKIPQYSPVSSKCSLKECKKVESSDEIGHIIHRDFLDPFCDEYVLIGEEETSLGINYLQFEEEIRTFEIRNSDIIVASYPKAGTTWTQEMVWLIGNDLDFKAAEEHLDKRFPHFELCTIVNFAKMTEVIGSTRPEYVCNSINYLRNLEGPRFIKTHLTYNLLPEQILNGNRIPKIIYVLRDPKDVCVSYYHHGRLIQGWRADFKNFSKVFLSEKIMFGSYWKHVLGYWEHRDKSNVLILTYEEMKNDLLTVLRKTAQFLDRKLNEDKIPQLLKHLSFESMKNNRAVNQQDKIESRMKHKLVPEQGAFMRSGTSQNYKGEMSDELIVKFDEWTKRSISGSSFMNEPIADLYLNTSQKPAPKM